MVEVFTLWQWAKPENCDVCFYDPVVKYLPARHNHPQFTDAETRTQRSYGSLSPSYRAVEVRFDPRPEWFQNLYLCLSSTFHFFQYLPLCGDLGCPAFYHVRIVHWLFLITTFTFSYIFQNFTPVVFIPVFPLFNVILFSALSYIRGPSEGRFSINLIHQWLNSIFQVYCIFPVHKAHTSFPSLTLGACKGKHITQNI